MNKSTNSGKKQAGVGTPQQKQPSIMQGGGPGGASDHEGLNQKLQNSISPPKVPKK